MTLNQAYRLAIAVCAMLFPAGAGQAKTASRAACLLHADVADPDPAGTNIRSGPSPTAPILARLPHARAMGGDSVAPELDVIGFEHGWAQVRRVHFADYGQGETMLFAGSGWIAGRLLSAQLVGMPVATAAAVRTSAAASPGVDGAVITAIDDCDGRLAHVVARLADGRRIEGWTGDLCANQVTTCS